MECFWGCGGARFHLYVPYKTLFLRRLKYYCLLCNNSKLDTNGYEVWRKNKYLVLEQEYYNARKT